MSMHETTAVEECAVAEVRAAVDDFSSDVIDAVDMLDEVSWNDASWRRMVNMFFLREINAHRRMRSNLRNGSASVTRMLRQERSSLTTDSHISTAIMLQAEGPARSD